MKIKILIATMLLISACSTAKKAEETAPPIAKHHYDADTSFHPRATKPAYVKKHPKLCFDQGHRNLAVAKGFYAPVLELLESDGYEIIRITGRFSKDVLKGCELIYTSAAMGPEDDKKQSAFDDEEVKLMKEWVSAGGGMLIMPDHSPMADAMSPLLSQFQIESSIKHLGNPKKPIAGFDEDGVFVADGEDLRHQSPIIRGRDKSEKIKKVYVFYGTALKGPKNADIFIKLGDGAKIGDGPEDHITTDRYPAEALALKFGSGRVVAFGDGTVFTSKIEIPSVQKTGINHEGSDNVQLALNVFHWLSKL